MRLFLLLVPCVVCGGLFVASAASGAAEENGNEDLKAAVVGKWVSDDEERVPLEFLKDGTAKVGLTREKGKWLIATGKYTVSDKGRVAYEVKHEGTTLRESWTLKDGVLVGPRGANLMFKWVKARKNK